MKTTDETNQQGAPEAGETTLPPVGEAPKDERTPMQRFYDGNVRELADQLPEPEREQIATAFLAPPQSADDVDPWFIKHFHAAPVAHDTALFNRLGGLKAALRDVAGN